MTHMNFLTCLLIVFLKNGPTPASFVGVSGIRTRIVGIEGEHADHLTTTTAHWQLICQEVGGGEKPSHIESWELNMAELIACWWWIFHLKSFSILLNLRCIAYVELTIDFLCLVESKPLKQEASGHTVRLPLSKLVSVLCIKLFQELNR